MSCPLPHHPTNVPQSLAGPPFTYGQGRGCPASVTSTLHVSLGLLRPQLAASWVSEHPSAPGSGETRPGPSLPPAAAGRPRQGMGIHSPGSNPTCTVPQRERALQGHEGTGPPSRRQPVAALLTERQGPGCPRAPLRLHFSLSSLVFSSPCLSSSPPPPRC